MAQVNTSGNPDIDGILWGYDWGSKNLTYSFPTGTGEYGGYKTINGFTATNGAQQTAVRQILQLYENVCGLTFTETTTGVALLRFGMADQIDYGGIDTQGLHTPGLGGGSAESNPPDPDTVNGYAYGDMWFDKSDYNAPVLGDHAYTAGFMHEIGHAVGLKHGQNSWTKHGDFFPTLPADHLSNEYSVMNYASFVGDPVPNTDAAPDHPTTLMQDDIAALQYMYGANFNTNSGNTVYTWDAATGQAFINGVGQGVSNNGEIFETVWDGGGHDTYDFSNYSFVNLTIDLRPGAWSSTHLHTANLGPDGAGVTQYARGEIANALLYQGNTASLIEDAIGGAGDDTMTGNDANNTLIGNGGNDTLDGQKGYDTLIGGRGNDTYILSDVARPPSSRIFLSFDSYDKVVEDPNGGIDTVKVGQASGYNILLNRTVTFTSYTLGDNIENGVVTGTGVFNLTGNALNNVLTGNAYANNLTGGEGDDTLDGGAGHDVLIGGAGNDTYVLNDVARIGSSFFGPLAYDVVQEDANAGVDTVEVGQATGYNILLRRSVTYSSYTLGDNVENGVVTGVGTFDLTGNGLDNVLTGNGAANRLTGGDGDDTLDGRGGHDILIGGAGDDTYVLNDLARTGSSIFSSLGYDSVQEDQNGGLDTVEVGQASGYNILLRRYVTYTTYALGDNVENGLVIGAGAFDLTGNGLNNALTGNGAANRLIGGDGDDTLDGRGGHDILIGGAGDDTYVLNDVAHLTPSVFSSLGYDAIVEDANGGVDTVEVGRASAFSYLARRTLTYTSYTLGDNVENGIVTGTGAFDLNGNGLNNVLTGNAAANVLRGGDGDDRLDGRGGHDTLLGGAGNDTYVLADVAHTGASIFSSLGYDSIVEDPNGGVDTVEVGRASGYFFPLHRTIDFTSYTLGDNVENGVVTGAGAFDLTGNGLDNTLTGNASANVLDGGLGADTLIGGLGNDSYIVDNKADKVIEAVGGGADKVLARVNYTLGAGQEIETLAAANVNSTIGLSLTGNAFANTIVGDAGADRLDGGLGADRLLAGLGADVLIGGGGNDVLTGGGGADTFVFGAGFGQDTIMDFMGGSAAGHDFISFAQSIFHDASAVMAHISEVGTNAVIAAGATDSITLRNFNAANLLAADLRFV